MKPLGVFLIVLGLGGFFVIVPTGMRESYGRLSYPSYEPTWDITGHRSIDTTRLIMQTVILLGGGLVCLMQKTEKKP